MDAFSADYHISVIKCPTIPSVTTLVNNFGQLSLKLMSRDDKFYCHNAQNSILAGAVHQILLGQLTALPRYWSWSFGEKQYGWMEIDGRGKGKGQRDEEREERKGAWGMAGEEAPLQKQLAILHTDLKYATFTNKAFIHIRLHPSITMPLVLVG